MLSTAISLANLMAKLFEFRRDVFNKAYRKAKKDIQESTGRKQFEYAYAPLRALLLEVHVTTGQAMLYPYSSMRIKRTMRLVRQGKYRQAITAVGDKEKPELSGEVKFGPFFSLPDVKKIMVRNPEWIDSKLMNLYQQADRAQYEDHKRDLREILPQELELVLHICKKYDKLSARFAP